MLRLTSSLNCLRRNLPGAAMIVAAWAVLFIVAKVSCVSVLTPLLAELRSCIGTAREALPISGFLATAAGALRASVGQSFHTSTQS
jgi:hypothetical protein